MKTIALRKSDKIALVDDEDFEWLSQWRWYNNKSHAFKVTWKNRKSEIEYMSRAILRYHGVVIPNDIVIDHINRNGLDNQKINLRFATRSQNQANSRLPKNNTSGIKGVCWHKRDRKWVARVAFRGRRINLGYFENFDEAVDSYDKKSKELFGEFYQKGEIIGEQSENAVERAEGNDPKD